MRISTVSLYAYLLRYAQGRENAVKSAEIESYFGCGGRLVRTTIPLVENTYNMAVLSSYDPDTGGYYIPASEEEALEGAKELDAHAKSEIGHVSRKKKLIEAMFGEVQLTLGS